MKKMEKEAENNRKIEMTKMAVWEHGCSGEEAEGNGNGVHAAEGGGKRNRGRSAVLPRPRWFHGRDLQLRQPPCHPTRRSDGPNLLQTQSPDAAAAAHAGGEALKPTTHCLHSPLIIKDNVRNFILLIVCNLS